MCVCVCVRACFGVDSFLRFLFSSWQTLPSRFLIVCCIDSITSLMTLADAARMRLVASAASAHGTPSRSYEERMEVVSVSLLLLKDVLQGMRRDTGQRCCLMAKKR